MKGSTTTGTVRRVSGERVSKSPVGKWRSVVLSCRCRRHRDVLRFRLRPLPRCLSSHPEPDPPARPGSTREGTSKVPDVVHASRDGPPDRRDAFLHDEEKAPWVSDLVSVRHDGVGAPPRPTLSLGLPRPLTRFHFPQPPSLGVPGVGTEIPCRCVISYVTRDTVQRFRRVDDVLVNPTSVWSVRLVQLLTEVKGEGNSSGG